MNNFIYKVKKIPSVNNLYLHKGFKVFKTKLGKDFDKDLRKKWIDEDMPCFYEDRVKLSLWLYFGDNRIRDIDNYNKGILDALIGVAYIDDSQIMELHVFKSKDKKNPRIEINIERWNNE